MGWSWRKILGKEGFLFFTWEKLRTQFFADGVEPVKGGN
jgi:hypothetical protein